jgi:cytoskeletal protein CcmA (bactofilin family)
VGAGKKRRHELKRAGRRKGDYGRCQLNCRRDRGTISYSGTVRIDGYLDGEIHTDGMLLIGEEAVIQAKITAGTVVSKGKITGEVVAKECVKLRAPAVMNGSVKAPVLSMEDGVLFNGALEMAHAVRELPRDISPHPVGMIMPPSIKRANG